MITVKKKMHMDIWEANLCTGKSYAQVSILGTLDDTDEGSGVHLVGYDHRGKKRVVMATRKLYHSDAKEKMMIMKLF